MNELLSALGMGWLHVGGILCAVVVVIMIIYLHNRAIDKLTPEERKQIGREMNRLPPRGPWM